MPVFQLLLKSREYLKYIGDTFIEGTPQIKGQEVVILADQNQRMNQEHFHIMENLELYKGWVISDYTKCTKR